MTCFTVLADRRDCGLEGISRGLSVAADLNQRRDVALETPEFFVEVGAVGPYFGLRLRIGRAEAGPVWKVFVEQAGKERQPGRPLVHLGGIGRGGTLQNRRERTEIRADQREGSPPRVDGLPGRRRSRRTAGRRDLRIRHRGNCGSQKRSSNPNMTSRGYPSHQLMLPCHYAGLRKALTLGDSLHSLGA